MVSPGASAGVESHLCSAPSVFILPEVKEWLDILKPRSTKLPNDLCASEK